MSRSRPPRKVTYFEPVLPRLALVGRDEELDLLMRR